MNVQILGWKTCFGRITEKVLYYMLSFNLNLLDSFGRITEKVLYYKGIL